MNFGNVFYQLKRYERAIQIYEYVREKRPDLALVQYNLGVSYFALKRWAEASERFESFIELEPDHAKGHYYAGASLARTGQVQLAITRLARATLLDPSDPWAPADLARLAFDLGDLATAEAYVKTALDRERDEPEILMLGGLVARVRGRYPEAVNRLERAVSLAPKRAPPRAELGYARILSGDLDGGIDDLEGARTLAPTSRRVLGWLPVARTHRAIRHLNAGEAGAAEGDLRRALEVQPAMTDAAWNLGLLFDSQGRNDDGIQMLQNAQRAHPGGEPNLHLLTAYLLVRAGRAAEAQGELRDARGATDTGLRWLVQGAVHGRFGEFDAAIAAFQRAAEQGIDTTVATGFARLDKAAAQLRDGRVLDALDELRRPATQVDPEQARIAAALTVVGLLRLDRDFAAIERLLPLVEAGGIPLGWGLERLTGDVGLLRGYVRYRRGDETGALAALESWRAEHPDDPRGHRLMAVLLTDLAERDHSARRFRRAEARARRAARLRPGDPLVRHNLACILYGMGNHEEASRLFAQLADDGSVPEATINLALYYDDVAGRSEEATPLYRRYLKSKGLASELARRRLARKERIFGE